MNVDKIVAKIVSAYRDERDLMRAKISLGNRLASHVRRHCTNVHCKGEACYKTKRTLCKEDKALADAVEKRIKQTALIKPKPLRPELGEMVEDLAILIHPVAGHLAVMHKQTEILMNARRKEIEGYVAELPLGPWIEGICGLGLFGVGQLIAEAGRDLRSYGSVRCLWKRMGVGRTLIKGEWVNQKRDKNAENALAHGYRPDRRKALYSIGDALIKKQNIYRDSYLEYKAKHAAQHPDGKPKWHDLHAQRLMVKDLLKDFYVEWTKCLEMQEAA